MRVDPVSGARIALSIPFRPIVLGQAPCMARNHQVFVRRNDPRGGPATGYRDPGAADGVRPHVIADLGNAEQS